ncbi:hypothetical protein TH63_16650 [Rufibacter radiotolerans]|uniref:Uncharacterized protein n=2 Tax=Rufibacter radiotolerans TaxID=1379910 RepID=A0A0H4VSY1_9BACT|nr:hypothetical protein TH63_16650 [Rufibacter radiotolerans]
MVGLEPQSSRDLKRTGVSESSLIGKTTVEVANLGWLSCALTYINIYKSKYSIVILAKSQEECGNGKGKILLERYIGRNGNKMIFEVLDEINIKSTYPENEYIWTSCEGKGVDREGLYIINYKVQQQAKFTSILELWAVDLKAGKFIQESNVDSVTCLNPIHPDNL